MKIVPHRVEVFFGVQCPVFTGGVTGQRGKQSINGQGHLAISLYNSRRVSLQVVLNGLVQFGQQTVRIIGCDATQMELKWQWLRQEVTGVLSISGNLPCADDQTRERVGAGADTCEISPRIRGVAGVDSDRISVN